MQKQNLVSALIAIFVLIVIVAACNLVRERNGGGYSNSGSTTRKSLNYPLTFSTSRILELKQLQGSPEWIERKRERTQNAVWKFDSDGTFTFSCTPAGLPLVIPVQGTFEANGNYLEFAASKTASVSTGSQTVKIDGRINLDTQEVEMNWLESAGVGGVVANTQYTNAATDNYRIRAKLK